MLPGLNHNVRYKGKVYHVQTEDSGLDKPHVITILYEGGAILSRKRTSYADIVSSDHISDVVRDLMQKQHKEMLRYLKSGALEEKQGTAGEGAPASARPSEGGPEAGKAVAASGGNGPVDEIILDFMTGESGKRRPSGGAARSGGA